MTVPGELLAQVAPGSSKTDAASGPQFSVMMWALNKQGTFEENLTRVAEAGYRHVELVGEFLKWSEDDWKRILARMQELKITVDATSGVKQGFADPSGQEAFLAELKGFHPEGTEAGVRADYSAVGQAG